MLSERDLRRALNRACKGERASRLVGDLLAKTVLADFVTELVTDVERQILADYPLYTDYGQFRSGEGGKPDERILDPKLTYLAANGPMLAYCNLCDLRTRAAGLKPDDMGDEYCPALVAQHERTKAEWALFEYFCPVLGMEKTGPSRLEDRAKLIELLVGAVLALEGRTADEARASLRAAVGPVPAAAVR